MSASADDLLAVLERAIYLDPNNQLESAQLHAAQELYACLEFDRLEVRQPNGVTDIYSLPALDAFSGDLPPELEAVVVSINSSRRASLEYLRELLEAVHVAHDILLEAATRDYGSTLVARSDLSGRIAEFRETEERIATDFGLGDLSPQAAAVEARAAASAAERAAGTAAKARQAKSFDDLATAEAQRAMRLQVVAVACLVGSAVAAGWFVSRLPAHDAALADLLPRLSVALPGLLLFGYFANEASGHRRHSAWARQIEVQLDTIDAFVAEFDEGTRADLVIALGRSVYAGPSLDLLNAGRWKSGGAETDALLRELVEALRSKSS